MEEIRCSEAEAEAEGLLMKLGVRSLVHLASIPNWLVLRALGWLGISGSLSIAQWQHPLVVCQVANMSDEFDLGCNTSKTNGQALKKLKKERLVCSSRPFRLTLSVCKVVHFLHFALPCSPCTIYIQLQFAFD